jgi:hypothetical protein
VPPVLSAAPTAPTVRGTMVTGRRSTLVNDARTLRLTWAGLCEPKKRVVLAEVGTVGGCAV